VSDREQLEEAGEIKQEIEEDFLLDRIFSGKGRRKIMQSQPSKRGTVLGQACLFKSCLKKSQAVHILS
jgi:hypothetical protein